MISENMVVTTNHALNYEDTNAKFGGSTLVQYLASAYGLTADQVRSRLSFRVTISRDVTISATMRINSAEMDFAILQLSQDLRTTTPLTIRNSSEVQMTEVVYAIGYPEDSSTIQGINTYWTDDVTITDGRINKIATGINQADASNTTEYFQTSCLVSAGNTGGPLVDENGYFIGVCQGNWGMISSEYFAAITIDQILEVCDRLGVGYQLASTPVPTPTPTDRLIDTSRLRNLLEEASSSYKKDEYTEASYNRLENAMDSARRALSSGDQATVDSAYQTLLQATSQLEPIRDYTLYYIIGGIAVVIIILIILLVVFNRRRREPAPTPTPNPDGGGFSPANYPPIDGRGNQLTGSLDSGTTSALNPGDTSTVLLDNNDGNTALLTNGGVMIRKKTGDRLVLNKAEIVIGRQANTSDYCITDNKAVGRTHAKLLMRDGYTYLVDLKSTNGTFINGMKCEPNKEMQLNDGDKIKLADEEFIK